MTGKRVQTFGESQPKIRKFCKAEEEIVKEKESPFLWEFYETEDTYIENFFNSARDEIVKEKESPFIWEFYETDDTYIIDEYTRARLVWNDYHEVDMLHFARKNSKGKLKHISLTSYEACTFLDFLAEILNQIQDVKDLGKPGQALISFFDGKAKDRAYEHESASWESFWKSPDLILPSIRVRVGLNRKTGMYMMFINSPVSTKLSLEYHNWQGPQVIFKLTTMIKMLEFLKLSVNDTNTQESLTEM